MILHTEWILDSAVLVPIWDTCFCPLVNLFVTRFNHRLPTFVSPLLDPAAWAVDALCIPWLGLLAYAFPPSWERYSGKPGRGKPHSPKLPQGGQLSPGYQNCCVSPIFLLSSSTFTPEPSSNPGQELHMSIQAFLTLTPDFCVTLVFIRGFSEHDGQGLSGSSFWHPIYSSHWSRWLQWFQDNQVDPCKLSHIQVSIFLAFLSRSFCLGIVHQCIVQLFALLLVSSALCPFLITPPSGPGLFCVNQRCKKPQACSCMGPFSGSLCSASFPLLIHEISLKHLTLKTAFLMALASGLRCCEVHAPSGLPSDVASEPVGSISLRFLPEFLAKNQSSRGPVLHHPYQTPYVHSGPWWWRLYPLPC